MSQRNYLFLKDLLRKGFTPLQVGNSSLVKDVFSVLRQGYLQKYNGESSDSLRNERIVSTGYQFSSSKELKSPTLVDKHFREISENPLINRKISPTQFKVTGTACHGSSRGNSDTVIDSFQDEVAAGQATESKALYVLRHYYHLIKMPSEVRNESLIKHIAAGTKVLSWLRASNADYRYLHRDMLWKYIYAEGGFPAICDYMREESRRLRDRRVPPETIDYWKTTLLTVCVAFHLNRGDQIKTVIDMLSAAKLTDSPFKPSHSLDYEFVPAERSIVTKMLFLDKMHLDDKLIHRFLTLSTDSPEYSLMEALLFTKIDLHLTKRFKYVRYRLLDPDISRSVFGWRRLYFIKLTLDVAEELLEVNRHNDGAWLLSTVKARFPACFDIDLDKADCPVSCSKSCMPSRLPALDRLAGIWLNFEPDWHKALGNRTFRIHRDVLNKVQATQCR